MTDAPKNPAAFPMTGEGFGSPLYSQYGMTLRDYFAAAALPEILSKCFVEDIISFTSPGYERLKIADMIAWRCGEIADAMLAEREKGGAEE